MNLAKAFPLGDDNSFLDKQKFFLIIFANEVKEMLVDVNPYS